MKSNGHAAVVNHSHNMTEALRCLLPCGLLASVMTASSPDEEDEDEEEEEDEEEAEDAGNADATHAAASA
jgi:hypothetical protein